MKADRIRAEITVGPGVKVFALIVSLLDTIYSDMERKRLIRQLMSWYGVQ